MKRAYARTGDLESRVVAVGFGDESERELMVSGA
jgi:hypothetical protein